MRSGGIWAVAGSYLLTSTDNGASWRAGDIPAGMGRVRSSCSIRTTPGRSLPARLRFGATPRVAHRLESSIRTSDGGGTWQQTSVSGDFSCGQATFSFVDADHGFLMCATYARPKPGPCTVPATKGSGTLLRTVDGGATWRS